MPRKIRQLKKDLTDLGFTRRSIKGSHQVWIHPLLVEHITIARKDGEDVPAYLERKLKIALRILKEEKD